MYRMKPLSERPAESRKPLTKFYGITASESELLPLKTDKSTKTQRTTSNGGLSLPCSSSALMNSHTPKLNNRRHIERHTKTGNHKRFPVFLRLFLAFLKNRRIAPRKGKYDTLFVWQFSIFGGVGNERKMKKFFKIPAYSDLLIYTFIPQNDVLLRHKPISAPMRKTGARWLSDSCRVPVFLYPTNLELTEL